MADAVTHNLVLLLAKWREQPWLFPLEAFVDPPSPEKWQDTALRALPTEDRIAIRSGNGVGKTTFLAWVILWFALTRYPFKIPCTAPSAPQLSSALWPEIAKWHRQLHPALRRMLRMTSDRLELVSEAGTSFAEARTSRKDQPEALQGFHEDNLLFIIDEAAGVPDIIFEVGDGSLSTPGAKIVMTGNPAYRTGRFYHAFHPRPGERTWWTMRVSGYDSTRVSREWIEEMKSKYGEGSPQFQYRVLGEFPGADEQSYIPSAWVEAAVQRRQVITVEPGLEPVVWGLDVGYAHDRCALACRQGNHLLEPVRWWVNHDTMQTAARVVQMYDRLPQHLRPVEILVDANGLGAGTCHRLQEEGLPATAVNVSERPFDKDRYHTLRQNLYGRMLDWFESTDTTMPDDSALIEEMARLRGKPHDSGRVYAESKKDMRARGEASCDLVDSLMLTFAASSRWQRTPSPARLAALKSMPQRTVNAYNPRSW